MCLVLGKLLLLVPFLCFLKGFCVVHLAAATDEVSVVRKEFRLKQQRHKHGKSKECANDSKFKEKV